MDIIGNTAMIMMMNETTLRSIEERAIVKTVAVIVMSTVITTKDNPD